MPRVIIGSPLFNHAGHFRESIEAILNQTFTDFALVLVDDGSTDATGDIAREYAAIDSRVSYHRNAERLGLIDNSRTAFALARGHYPEAEYFAWTSDHDLCHPRWLERLVEALDTSPRSVLAYPMNRRIGPSGELLMRKPWRFDTAGIESKWTRLNVGIRHMRAGNMIYGLFRIAPLLRAGVYRKVVIPDRLLFGELSLYGEFTQVPRVLWFRRWNGRVFSLGRQRASFFPGRRPLYSYIPWWIAHAASLFWTFAVRGDGRPDVSRAQGVRAALQYGVLAALVHVWQTLRTAGALLVDWLDARRRSARRVLKSARRRAAAYLQ